MFRRPDMPRLQASFDLFVDQQKKISNGTASALNQLANDIRSLADRLEANGSIDCKSPADLLKPVRKQLASMLKTGTLEVGNMYQKMEAACDPIEGVKVSTPLDYELLDRVVINHFLRSGRFGVAQSLIIESQLNFSFDDRFVILDVLLQSLRRRDVTKCVNWCRNQGDSRDYHFLLFHLHRMEYLQLLEQGQVYAGVKYARANFPVLFPEYAAQIGDLMGMLIFVYSKLRYVGTSNQDWVALEKLFISVFCKNMGLAKESPLSVCVAASQIALPPLVKINALQLKNSALHMSCNASEIALDLGKKFQYHSTFVCPVSKTIDDKPMMLLCGHVISRSSLENIPRIGRNTALRTFKCPYCSVEQTIQDSLPLQF